MLLAFSYCFSVSQPCVWYGTHDWTDLLERLINWGHDPSSMRGTFLKDVNTVKFNQTIPELLSPIYFTNFCSDLVILYFQFYYYYFYYYYYDY